jgi:23S rRNA U2552 (ribose-2'-O)-methylase RlmE/FtsJ
MIDWDHCWGDTYALDYKVQDVVGILDQYDYLYGLGDVILDVGSSSVVYLKYLQKPHRIVAVDIAGAARSNQNILGLQFDITKIVDETSQETREAVAKVAAFLGVDCLKPDSRQQVDCVVLSDVLNYLDYPAVLQNLHKYVKLGGKLVIANRPGRGYDHLFSPQHPSSNTELLQTLQGMGFVFRHVHYDVLLGETEDNCYIVAIAEFPQSSEEHGDF